ncbi:hypothetical protein COOONC_26592 [Cooperia oncophora]
MNISVPKHAPTDVEVFQEGDNVLVDFEPLPLSKIPGQTPAVNNISRAVAVLKRAGMGPQSPWLTFTTGKLETKKPRKTTTTVTTTTTAPEPAKPLGVTCPSR